MEQQKDALEMLDLMVQPGFCVLDGRIIKVNSAAEGMHILPGGRVSDLICAAAEDYQDFSGGCLYLTLSLFGVSLGASVTRVGQYDIFLLEQNEDQRELQAMALAAKELRAPLASIMVIAEQLFPMESLVADPGIHSQVTRMNRGLFQMLRVISNMSDAVRYTTNQSRPETMDICAFVREVFGKAQSLLAQTGLELTFSTPAQPIFCLADREKLERAVLNILSNAAKFTPAGGRIAASLTRKGSRLYLSVQDSGEGVPDSLRGNIHSRYLRQPGLEDHRYGLGLGMVLIRSAAAAHGGTVLIDQPEGTGTRITMTLEIRQAPSTNLRSPQLYIDYAGERDHSLVELADVLPASAFDL